jgi:hypothetical protein
MNADNVLYIKIGDKVTVKDNVDFTKAIATDGWNNQKAIGITSNGVIDFTGYAQGVSTLDVVVDDDRAYEAIIVIGQQPPEVINKQVTKVNNNQQFRVQLGLYPDPPKCDEGEKLIDGKCVPIPYPICPDEDADGHECPPPVECPEVEPCDVLLPIEPEPEPMLVDCNEGWHADASGTCQPIDPENPIMPTCEENPNQPDCEMPTEEFLTEGIDCELQPELCEENIPLEETEEEELPEEEELTETTEIEELEEEESEEDESGESEDEAEDEGSEQESEGGN